MNAGAMPRLPRAACRTPEGADLFLNVTSNTVPACRRVCMDCPEPTTNHTASRSAS